MKISQDRIRPNGSKSVTTSQAKAAQTKALSDELLAALDRENAFRLASGIVTCVWIGPDKRELARVDFPREIFSRIEEVRTTRGMTLHDFCDDAVHHYCGLCKDCMTVHGS